MPKIISVVILALLSIVLPLQAENWKSSNILKNTTDSLGGISIWRQMGLPHGSDPYSLITGNSNIMFADGHVATVPRANLVGSVFLNAGCFLWNK